MAIHGQPIESWGTEIGGRTIEGAKAGVVVVCTHAARQLSVRFGRARHPRELSSAARGLHQGRPRDSAMPALFSKFCKDCGQESTSWEACMLPEEVLVSSKYSK